jgi:peptidoglycan hydrolase-like protein with peptidoglycan-binding domain
MKRARWLAAVAAVALGMATFAGRPALAAGCMGAPAPAPSSGGEQGGSGDRGSDDNGAAEGYRQGAENAADADLDSHGGGRRSGGGAGGTSQDYTSQINALGQAESSDESGAARAGGGASSSGADAAAAQAQLNRAGYDTGPLDGAPGDRTTAAIKRYQSDNGLPITGVLDDPTRAKLGMETAAPGDDSAAAADGPAGPAPDPATMEAQSQLTKAGYYTGPMDGKGGEGTTAAIRQYQHETGLPATGQLDEATRAGLGLGTSAPATDGPAGPAPDPATMEAQSQLSKAGYYTGPQDGKGGESTTAAIKQYQHDNGLPATGELDELTRARLGLQAAAPGVDNGAAAGGGDQAATLLNAQSLLSKAGYYNGPMDGKPGASTTAAIKQYQRDTRLPITGALDELTRARLGAAR